MQLTKIERETIINFNEEEPLASVYTHNRPLIRRLNKLAQISSEVIVEKQTEDYGEYLVPKRLVGIKFPRILSEEKRQELADRARTNFEKKVK